jgi:hypothetical protein
MHPILAGIVATAAMSTVMRSAQGLGLLRRPPPGTITERALGLKPALQRPSHAAVNTIAHFAYGTGLALLFAGMRRHGRLPLPKRTPWLGMSYGLAVYAANYEALLPMLGLMPPAHRDDARRVGAMIAAHLAYGATLELLVRCRNRSPNPSGDYLSNAGPGEGHGGAR